MFRKSEGKLISSILAGHREEYGKLVDRYWPLAYSVGFAHSGNFADAQDVAQDALLTAFQKLDTLRERDRFAPWLASIARNVSNKLLAKRRREQAEPAQLAPPEVIIPDLEEREMRELVRAQLMQMEEAPREVLVLHYFSGMSTREIGRALAISTDAAEKRLQRARKELGDALLEHLRQPAESRLDNKRRDSLMGLVAAAPVAWKTSAATASLAAILLRASRLHYAAALMVTCGIGVGLYVLNSGHGISNPPETTTSLPVQADTIPEVPLAKPVLVSELPPAPQQTPPSGSRTVRGYTLNCEQKPLGGATVTLVEGNYYHPIDWDSPPLQTTQSGPDGSFVFENVSDVVLSVVAWTDGTIGYAGAGSPGYEFTVYVPMLPASSISGRVVDAAGKPVEGALVAPNEHEGDGKFYPHTRKKLGDYVPASFAKTVAATTDVEGRFTIPRVWPGTWILAARKEGYGWAVTPLVPAGASDAELVLGAECRIIGTVADPAGAPVAGADVYLSGDTAIEHAKMTTGADGAFTFEGLRPMKYGVNAGHPAWVQENHVELLLLEPGKTTTATIAMAKGATVCGRVIDAATGEPIAGAEARCSGAEPGRVVTGPDGSFCIEHIRSGTQDVNASCKGYAWLPGHSINLALDEVLENVDLPLTREPSQRTISGMVINESGRPVKGATVTVEVDSRYSDRGVGSHGGIQTDEHGCFEVVWPTAKYPVYLAATKGELTAPPEGPYEIGEDGLQDVAIRLRRGWGAIRGRVVDAKGNPVLEPHVGSRFVGPQGQFHSNLVMQKIGWFEIRGVIPGTYHLTACSRHGEGAGLPQEVTIAEGEEVDDVVLVYGGLGNLAIAGSVVDETGAPVPRKELTVQPMEISSPIRLSTVTDAQGRFRFEGLSEGLHEITGYPITTVRVAAGDMNVLLETVRGAVIEGTVRLPDGSPAREFEIGQCWEGQRYETASWDQKILDEGGRFRINVEAGDRCVIARAAGYNPGFVNVDGLQPGEVRQGVKVVLEDQTRMVSRVTAQDGRPVEGASIYTHEISPSDTPDRYIPNDADRAMATTDAAGEFEIFGMIQKPQLFYARHSQYKPSKVVALMPQSQTTVEHHFVLTPGGSVSGRVLHNGVPVPDATVRGWVSEGETPEQLSLSQEPYEPGDVVLANLQNVIVGSGMKSRPRTIWTGSTQTGKDGRYTLAGVEAGTLKLAASWQQPVDALVGFEQQISDIQMTLTAAVKMDFNLPDDRAEVSGEVFVNARQATQYDLRMTDETGITVTVSGRGNTFRAGHLPAGLWQLTASGSNGAEWASEPRPIEFVLAPAQRQTIQLTMQVDSQPAGSL